MNTASKTTRLLILALLGVVLAGIIAGKTRKDDAGGDRTDDPPCFASKLGLPCRGGVR